MAVIGEIPTFIGPRGAISVGEVRPPVMEEFPIWSVKNYRITFDPATEEMVYRVKVPTNKLKAVL